MVSWSPRSPSAWNRQPDVRFVAHMDLPRSVEGYYQETGRAGRDGEPAEAWMAWGLQDVVTQRRFIDEGEAEDAHKRIGHAKLDGWSACAKPPAAVASPAELLREAASPAATATCA
jgi:superfamily II DNA helicase RecQ